jgi:hypothetical protein
MRTLTTLVCAAAALALALPADAQRGGRGGGGGGGWSGGGHGMSGGRGFSGGGHGMGGGRPVASFPGGKPSTGGWSGHRGGGWSGRHGGHYQGGHYGHYRGGHSHGYRPYYPYYSSYYYRPWPIWGIGVGIGWPYWGGWGYPAYPAGAYRGYWYPAEGPVYVNPDPMPSYGEPAFRWYCPASAAYYPEVRDCAQPWLKVAPSDGSGPPPSQEPEAEPAPPPATYAPDVPDVSPGAEPAPTATTGRVRIAAPRMTSPTEIASRRSMQDAVALGDLR